MRINEKQRWNVLQRLLFKPIFFRVKLNRYLQYHSIRQDFCRNKTFSEKKIFCKHKNTKVSTKLSFFLIFLSKKTVSFHSHFLHHEKESNGVNFNLIDWFLFDGNNWYRLDLCIDDMLCKSKETIITGLFGNCWWNCFSETVQEDPEVSLSTFFSIAVSCFVNKYTLMRDY